MKLELITNQKPLTRCPKTRRVLNPGYLTLTAMTVSGPRTIEITDGFQRDRLWELRHRGRIHWQKQANGVSLCQL